MVGFVDILTSQGLYIYNFVKNLPSLREERFQIFTPDHVSFVWYSPAFCLVQDSLKRFLQVGFPFSCRKFLTGIPPSIAMTSTKSHVHLAGKYLDRFSRSLALRMGSRTFTTLWNCYFREGLVKYSPFRLSRYCQTNVQSLP